MKRFENKVVVITGASSGLGKASAIAFAKEGANLAICARREEKLKNTAELCKAEGADVLTFSCDVTNRDQLIAFTDAINEHFGRVDVLMNNAVSADQMIPFVNQTLESLDMAMNSGLYATWIMMQRCYPMMKDNGGSVINLGTAAADGLAGFASYGAAKAAVMSLTMTAALEWGADNIRVNNVLPYFLSENLRDATDPDRIRLKELVEGSFHDASAMHRTAYVEDIVPAVLFLASDESSWITGQSLRVEGGTHIHW